MYSHVHVHTAVAALVLLLYCSIAVLSPLLYYSQSLQLSKSTEGVGQVILERVCLKVYDDSSISWEKVWILQGTVLKV